MPLLEGFCRSADVSDSCTAFMKSPAVSAFCTLMTSPSQDLIGMLSLLYAIYFLTQTGMLASHAAGPCAGRQEHMA